MQKYTFTNISGWTFPTSGENYLYLIHNTQSAGLYTILCFAATELFVYQHGLKMYIRWRSLFSNFNFGKVIHNWLVGRRPLPYIGHIPNILFNSYFLKTNVSPLGPVLNWFSIEYKNIDITHWYMKVKQEVWCARKVVLKISKLHNISKSYYLFANKQKSVKVRKND